MKNSLFTNLLLFVIGAMLLLNGAVHVAQLLTPQPQVAPVATAAAFPTSEAIYIAPAAPQVSHPESAAGAVYEAPDTTAWRTVCAETVPVYVYPSHQGKPSFYLDKGAEVRVLEEKGADYAMWAYIGDLPMASWVDEAGLCQ
jgi:hypothetical protein